MSVGADGLVAAFDSASAMLRATARGLEGRDFFGLGVTPPAARALAPLVDALPAGLRRTLFSVGGAREAIAPELLGKVRCDQLGRWAAAHYRGGAYPLAFLGSSNGGLVHLATAMGAPWLPQTFLVPIRRRLRPGDMRADLEWGRRWGGELTRADPDLQLHHMHDPNQDELMVRRMAYFRIKLRRLPSAYRDFLHRRLAAGAPIVLIRCERSWPVSRVGARHFFQSGATGGLPDGAYWTHWDCPAPDATAPEAEWGFEAALEKDVEAVARESGHPVLRVSFEEPEDLAELVADLHRWWYARNAVNVSRLVVESFVLLEPWLALATGTVPLWLLFGTEPSARRLEGHLDRVGYDEIATTLFSHGIDSLGLAGIGRWRALTGRARRRGWMAGVNERNYPADFAVNVRFTPAMRRLALLEAPPPRLSLPDLAAFLEQRQDPRIQWAPLLQGRTGTGK